MVSQDSVRIDNLSAVGVRQDNRKELTWLKAKNFVTESLLDAIKQDHAYRCVKLEKMVSDKNKAGMKVCWETLLQPSSSR